ncbi:VirB8/TrbF family protein [Rubrivirga sp. S365]|uniref:VirB8/TrbF family protein n=1 Tax=Rubrivirga sp. S365 TaxID=3076080 RepID=UPI0028CAD338|nr:VirB8/TrbF family protein [Rubrivirga sp. S365]MDT7858197.1 VirB8/TrbF family protein [Rubrivirga sp. S365]
MSFFSRFKTGRATPDVPHGDGAAGVPPPDPGGVRPSTPPGEGVEGWAYGEKASPDVVRGRYEFARQFSDLTRGKRNWQVTAFASLALLALSVVGLVTLALQSRVVPYVVEVDRTGRAVAIAPAEAVPSVADRVVTSAIAGFVSNIRTAYPDPVAQRDAVYRAYAYVAGDARTFLESYFSDPANDPRQQGRGYRRSVEVTNVLPVPGGVEGGPTTYRVQWNEREASPSEGVRERAWEGYLAVVVSPPTTTEGVERNPLGVFVTDLSWSPLAAAAPVSASVGAPVGAPGGAAEGAPETGAAPPPRRTVGPPPAP